MGRLWWVALVATTGCSSVFGLGDPQPAPPDAPGASCTVAGFDLCAHQQPNGPIAFNADTVIDTTLDCNVVVFDPTGGSVCVIYATDITVGATVRAQGKRPLALAATGTIVVDGTVDVSSNTAKGLGGGANDAQCMLKRDAGNRSGGGAGGSFAGKGGDGGTGTVDPNTSGLASDPIQLPDRLRGGCAGGFGGSVGGSGGGGVALVASTSITIAVTGKILANGGGGNYGGGQIIGLGSLGASGGGSGGLVRIAAASISVKGTVTANGGGGGEGADSATNEMSQGMAGADGTTTTTAALGGAGGGNGGDGGGGTGGMTPSGGNGASPTGASLGGGGGGGGIGFVVLTGTTIDASGGTISPAPTL
jgi:hypothetical protein